MSESATPETGALSVEQAVASLVAPGPVEQEQPASEAPQEAAETEQSEGEPEAPDDAEDGAETPAEGEEGADAPEPEKLDAPLYWSTEAKAKFAALDPDMQAVVLSQEGPREEATAKAKAEAAKQVEAATTELSKVSELAVVLGEKLPQWISAFQDKWGQQAPDWVAIAQEHGVEAMTLAKTQFEADRQKLQDAANETARAQQLAHQQFLKTEAAKLSELAPELAPTAADPKVAAEKRAKVAEYLKGYEIPQAALDQISAAELTIAHKAMLYDQGQAALKAAPKPKPAAIAAKSPVRPAAGQAQPSSTRTATAAAQQFTKGGFRPEDAIALLLAKG